MLRQTRPKVSTYRRHLLVIFPHVEEFLSVQNAPFGNNRKVDRTSELPRLSSRIVSPFMKALCTVCLSTSLASLM